MAMCKSPCHHIHHIYAYIKVFNSKAFLEDFTVISLLLENFSNLQSQLPLKPNSVTPKKFILKNYLLLHMKSTLPTNCSMPVWTTSTNKS